MKNAFVLFSGIALLSMTVNVFSAEVTKVIPPISAGQTAAVTSAEIGGFTSTGININLSKNVGLAATGDPTRLSVNAGSTKGKNSYGATSNGGAVKECTSKPVDPTNGYGVAAPTISGDGCS